MSATIYRLVAMKDAGIRIAAVHIDRKFIVFENGLKLKIRLFNAKGERVKEPDEADHYEFGDDDVGYGSAHFDLMDFTESQ